MFIWDDNKIKFLIDNNHKLDDKSIIKTLGITNYEFYKKKRELGICNFKWTDEKIDILRRVYPTEPWDIICKEVGCYSKQSILSMASRNNIIRQNRKEKMLSDKDKDFIRNNSLDISVDMISNILHRDKSQIFNYCKKYNIKYFYNGQVKPWETDFFKNIYPYYTNRYLQEKYFPYLTKAQIASNATKFKIRKNQEKGLKQYDTEYLCCQLKDAINKLQRFPTNGEFKLLNLPSVKTYIRYFGSLTCAAQAIGVERTQYNRSGKLDYTKYYDKNNNFCLSVSEKIISNLLIDLDIPFKKEVPYSDFVPKSVAGNRRCDWAVDKKMIEFFGMVNYKDYNVGMEYKINLCKSYNIPLLELYPKDLKDTSLLKLKLLDFLNK